MIIILMHTRSYFCLFFLLLAQIDLFSQARYRDLPFSFGIGLNAGATRLHTGIPLNARIGPVVGLALNFVYPIGDYSEMYADAAMPEYGSFLLNEQNDPHYKLRVARIGVRYGFSWDVGAQRKWKVGPFLNIMSVFEAQGEYESFCNPADPSACIDIDDIYSLGLDLAPGVRLGYKYKRFLFGTMVSMSALNLQDEPFTTVRQSNVQFFANYYFIGNSTEDAGPAKKYDW
jgi:hypothetical protein